MLAMFSDGHEFKAEMQSRIREYTGQNRCCKIRSSHLLSPDPMELDQLFQISPTVTPLCDLVSLICAFKAGCGYNRYIEYLSLLDRRGQGQQSGQGDAH